MAEITIVEQDLIDGENLLEQILGDQIPEGDFSKGGALRDFAVKALASIFAYLKKESDTIRGRQSLLLLQALAEAGESDVDDAVDEILSNWYITRKTGRNSRGTVTVHFSQKPGDDETIEIPTNAAFFKTPALLFRPDSDSTLLYNADDMSAVVDSDGVVTSYTITVPLISAAVGAEYDVEPGSFADYTRFNPYILSVENTTKFTGGASTETTSEMLSRSETAISVRDLNSPRSIDVTLKEEFTNIDDLTVVGYGDDEMIRDLITEEAANTRIHSGGYVDIYLRNPILESKTYTATVGGEFNDPRPGLYILRDDTVPDFTDFGGQAVERGDIIAIQNYYPASEANEYVVNDVTPYGVYVSRRSQFPLELPEIDEDAEDEYDDGELGPTHTSTTNSIEGSNYTFSSDDIGKYIRVKDSLTANATMDSGTNNGTWQIVAVDTVNNRAQLAVSGGEAFVDETGVTFQILTRIVKYSIGSNSPLFVDKIPIRDSGRFTRSIQRNGRILLPAWPIYQIREVYVTYPGHQRADSDNKVWFTERINTQPGYIDPAGSDPLEYRLVGSNPGDIPSGWQVLELELCYTDLVNTREEFNGKTITVVYDTLTGYDSIWEFVAGERRILCGSVIPKGLHPVYLNMDIKYRLAKTAVSVLDENEAAEAVADYINNFDTREDMDTSDIVAFLRATYDIIGNIPPLTVEYQLLAPDGRVIYYETDDRIIIDTSKHQYPTEPEKCLDPTAAAPYNADAISLGISDNTVRYLTTADRITFTEES